MRRITFGCANSLDNFIARQDNQVDWLLWNEETGKIMTEYWMTIDAVIMGRKTFEVAMNQGSGGNITGGVQTFVFSRTWKKNVPEGVTMVSENAVEFVSNLKNGSGKDICLMGGGEFANLILEAGLVDEIAFNIHPVLLGSGIPLYHEMKCQINLTLRKCRSFENGCVYLVYDVLN